MSQKRLVEPDLLFKDQLEHLHNLCTDSVSALSYFNAKIFDVDKQLRAMSPKRDGTVLMKFSKCRGCLGCPHVSWVVWFNPHNYAHLKSSNWSCTKVKNPLLKATKQGSSDAILEQIRGGVKYLKLRGRLLKQLGYLNRSLTWLEKNDPEIFSPP